MTFFVKAIEQLNPGASWTIHGEDHYENLIWLEPEDGQKKPTEEEINNKVKELEEEYFKTEYQRKRSSEYPSITDQLDALYHAGVFPEEMAAKIKEIKDKYPKN